LTVRAEDVGASVECSICKTVFVGVAGTVPIVPPPPVVEEVDIAPCPKCRAELTVTLEDLGKEVECPHCRTVYTAQRPQPKAGTILARSTRKPDAPPPSDVEGKKKPYEFQAGKKKGSTFADDDDDDRSSRRKSRRDDDDDDDDDDDRPRRKKKRRRSRPSRSYDDLDDDRYRSYAPHDGGTMLVLAIVGWVCCFFISIYVIFKSSSSINEIRAGTMDPSGRGLLEAARIIAILDLLFVLVSIVLRVTGLVMFGMTDPDDNY
jgi:predicted Zn finger-like uncharacterized protein